MGGVGGVNLLGFLSALNKPPRTRARARTHAEGERVQRRRRKLVPSADWQLRRGTKDQGGGEEPRTQPCGGGGGRGRC